MTQQTISNKEKEGFEKITHEEGSALSFPDDLTQIKGKLIETRRNVGANNATIYAIQTIEGFKEVWGSTVLDSKMRHAEEGSEIIIEFTGMKPSEKRKGKEYKDFEVWVKKPKN